MSSAGVEEATFADGRGQFLVRIKPTAWAVVAPRAGGWSLRRVAVPAGAVDVAPVLDIGKMTGELAGSGPTGRSDGPEMPAPPG